MQLLPTPPTDNLYKFMAISGTWMVAGLLLLIFWMVYWGFQAEIRLKHVQAYTFSLNMEREISARLASIDKGKYAEHKLSWVPAMFTAKQERSFLQVALNNHKKTVAEYSSSVETENNNIIDYIGENKFMIAYLFYCAITLSLLAFGFGGWFKKVQKPNEQMHAIDYKIKELTLLKVQAEITALKKRTRSTRCKF